MGLSESKGHIHKDVTHTWNPIKGECPHKCNYCYMKRFGKQHPPHLEEKELKTDLGSGNFIFVGSSIDIFADATPKEWIVETLRHCEKYPDNKYLIQTKNPARLKNFAFHVNRYVLGTTIETNRSEICKAICKAPTPFGRAVNLSHFPNRKFVTIEPIMDFDLDELLGLIMRIKPEWVSIGVDSRKQNLPEPTALKILELIKKLDSIVLDKKYLKRIILK